MELLGTSIIGRSRGGAGGDTFRAYDPAGQRELEPLFHSASEADLDRAVALAAEAFQRYRRTTGKDRGRLLRAIADELDAATEGIVERGTRETAYPAQRLQMETARTANQLRLFAEVVEEGSWVEARVDHGDAEREPLPKPDLRSMLQPLGPVAVFCAANFPLACSVVGGDTCSALAAGNPVIVIAHHGHPGVSEIVGTAVARGIEAADMPGGLFSLLFAKGTELGGKLVRHSQVKAVGFTGSRKGGRALMDMAAARPEPIPVYAEMGSVNPVFILPKALEARGEQIAASLAASVTLGVGQFCTCPGVVVVPEGEAAGRFAGALAKALKEVPPSPMLNRGIAENYRSRLRETEAEGVESLVSALEAAPAPFCGEPRLYRVTGEAFLGNPRLQQEVFGPATLLVTARDDAERFDVARRLEGQLTATLHCADGEVEEHADLLSLLEQKVGRVVFNGYPTGIEPGHAIMHGGPYPATSDSRSTSIGTASITRYARRVCYQNFPDSALPYELREANPLGIRRMVNGLREIT